MALSRRDFLRDTLRAAGALAAGTAGGPLLPARSRAGRRRGRGSGIQGARNYGPLQAPDALGLRLPAGFSSRVVAVAGQVPASGSFHLWHDAPDGGAVFPQDDGGWIYVSNSELGGSGGGAGALRFDAAANVTDAYAILSGTSRNCAGGPTPWGTWISCEEVGGGLAWECDPLGVAPAQALPALGVYAHEAAAVDAWNGHIYLTEDQPDGLLYRFTPDSYPDLSSGVLEAAEAIGSDPFAARDLIWHVVPDPSASSSDTRYQVPSATVFNGGEGAFAFQERMYFTTKGDDRVWAIDVFAEQLQLIYDRATSPNPILANVDNVLVTPVRDVFVAEDPGDLELVAIAPNGDVLPVLQVTGQPGSEITGPALDPSGTRLYFSSQRGGPTSNGITYEVSGPFLD